MRINIIYKANLVSETQRSPKPYAKDTASCQGWGKNTLKAVLIHICLMLRINDYLYNMKINQDLEVM